METVDLDAMQREAHQETPKVVFGGKTFVLSAEMPVGVVLLLAKALKIPKAQQVKQLEALLAVVKELMGDANYTEFVALHPSLEVIERMFDAVLPMYGMGSLGESQGSESS
jgi:hypothetical protein